MSQWQGGDRSSIAWWQRAIAAAVLAVLGIVAGCVYAALNPAVPTSQTLVLSGSPPIARAVPAVQVVIADSDPVLAGALRRLGPAVSLAGLRAQVRVTSVTDEIISISAQGPTAAAARKTADAVADSYIAYDDRYSPGRVQAQVLAPAAIVSGPPLSHRLPVPAGLGALLGALIGAAAVVTPRRIGGGPALAGS